MHDEPAFLRALLADPADDGVRLVYADWLEEHNPPAAGARAEFLRLTVEEAANPGPRYKQIRRRKRLRELAADLDTDWLAVVSRLPVENCQKKRREAEPEGGYPIRFDYQCDRRWEDLQATDATAVRFCDSCRQNVHYCDTITAARRHAQNGHCIAVDLGIARRENDLGPQRRLLGRVSVDVVRREERRLRPDKVSVERERRKRAERASRRRGKPARSPARPVGGCGERVRVRDGTFAGMEGVVREVLEDRGAVRVELTVFGRTVPVELETWQVEQVAE